MNGDDERRRGVHDDVGHYRARAASLLASALDGTPAAVAELHRWDAPATPDGARAALARAHGFPSWAALERSAGPLAEPDDPFVRAFRAIEAHDALALEAILDAVPGVVHLRGTNDNDLLGFATRSGDPRAVRLLLGRGADPTHHNVHGWTALHQAAYMGRPDLAHTLLDAGAPATASARGEGGTPLVIALFWGHPVPEDLVERCGLAPGNLRVAAGLARLDLLPALADSPAGRAGRGFYRPHSGFPAWRTSDDAQEALDEALTWAARSDHPDAVGELVRLGADLERDVYRGTALGWAAALGRVATIRRLLDLGADPDGRTTFGGADHGEGATPLHLAAWDGHGDAVVLLLTRGADPDVRDARHDATPAEWALRGGHPEVARLLGEGPAVV